MTLIVGLKSHDSVVIAAEQEETGGITAKRTVSKLKLITGRDWAVVIGGAGDAALAENAMRAMERRLHKRKIVDEELLLSETDQILDSVLRSM
jgi:20S proteasome alpha/beta subunit